MYCFNAGSHSRAITDIIPVKAYSADKIRYKYITGIHTGATACYENLWQKPRQTCYTIFITLLQPFRHITEGQPFQTRPLRNSIEERDTNYVPYHNEPNLQIWQWTFHLAEIGTNFA